MVICFACAITAYAQQSSADTIERLSKEMYRLFYTDSISRFMEVTDRLKELCLQAGDERTFYKAWGNQATYIYSRDSHEKGFAIAHAEMDYAQQHQAKYGIYASSQTNASMLSRAGMIDQAEEAYLNTINYQKRYFPDESSAFARLGLCKIYQNRNQCQDMITCAQEVLKDKKALQAQRATALSYICIACADEIVMDRDVGKNKKMFREAYEMREREKAKYGITDSFEGYVKYYNAKINNQPDSMIYWANRINSPIGRYGFLASAYSMKGDYRQAYEYLKKQKVYKDSANNAEANKKSLENAELLGRYRAENEAKELMLHNQALKLAHANDELEQRRLEEEALSLTLKNREIELHNATIRLQNDSLNSYNKDLQLSEYQSKMEAQQSYEDAQRVLTEAIVIVALLTISYLAFYLHRRQRQMKRLREAYDQLEEVTSHKERIESELRIARDIQMSMVPSTFPERDGLDMYASMTPAKEVGGDLYGYLLQDDSLYFAIGDVSGKGVPASLFMAQVTRLFRTLANQSMMPAEICTRMNYALTEDNEQGMFVTMFIGLIDLNSGHLWFCNAGHNPPVIGGDATHGSFIEIESNAPIGLWPSMEFIGEELDNIKGRPLFIYTDGLNEAENQEQEQLGDDRLLEILRSTQFNSSQQVIETLQDEVRRHRNGADPNDDLTMMSIRIE